MHPKRLDILTALRNRDAELRLRRLSNGSYAAEIVRDDAVAALRVDARHALALTAAREVEPVDTAAPDPAGSYRLADHAYFKSDPDARETELITACALRFNGYEYIEERRIGTRRELDDGSSELDITKETERFFTQPDYGVPLDYQRMMLFLVQRKFIREGWLRWESRLAQMTRQLFIRTCMEEVPARFRFDDWASAWDRDFGRYAKEHVRFVKRRDRLTAYDDDLF